MAFVDPATLPNARCDDVCIPPGMDMAVLIYLFATWGGIPTDTPSLIAGAQPYCCLKAYGPGMQMAIAINLARQIAGLP